MTTSCDDEDLDDLHLHETVVPRDFAMRPNDDLSHAPDGTKTDRRADDFYVTPAWVTKLVLPYIAHVHPGLPHAYSILDPCCGEGAILDAVHEVMPKMALYGIEIDAIRSERASKYAATNGIVCGDALFGPPPRRDVALGGMCGVEIAWGTAQTVIMNPPFSLLAPFAERAVLAVAVVAMLARLNILAPRKYAHLWTLRDKRPDVMVLPKRLSFTDDGTDACEYAWFVWAPWSAGKWCRLEEPLARRVGGQRRSVFGANATVRSARLEMTEES